MQGEHCTGDEGPDAVARDTLGEHKDEVDHENVEQKADEMEAVGPQAEEPVADKVSPASSSAGSNW